MLSFLLRVCNRETTSLGTQVFSNIAASDVTSMSIIKQCYFLYSILETEFTNEVLNNPELCIGDLKKHVTVADRLKIVQSSKCHPSLSHILHIAEENLWMKLWDVSLEYGYDGITGNPQISLSLSDRRCPVSNCEYIVPQDTPLCEHFLECHTDFEPNVTPAYITNCILLSTSNSEHFISLISLGLSLSKFFPF